ncbi:MAG: UDP-2,3-diacylglucosamine diphosphatase LpxI [Alphaproteobacteria bacterium]|nr:UDP-2,3-diacylglucosamine diphosphatase LpxI [Alphaproteobacteria bacterium]
MIESKRKLGIIAGGGTLPHILINYCKQNEIPYFVLAVSGNADKAYFDSNVNHIFIRIGQAGTGFQKFKEEGIQDVVMIGTIRRPTLADLVPDMRTAAFFAKIGFKSLGDDGILRALIKEIESENWRVVGIHEIMPDILLKSGVLTKAKPDKQAIADIKRGVEVGLKLGELDVGQSVVVQQGLVLGVEGIEGTDELIKRCADYQRKGDGGVLVKLRKPQQDMRIDLPTIGLKTIENAHKSGLKGLAVHAGNALVVDEKEVIQLADQYKMFLIGINPAEYI